VLLSRGVPDELDLADPVVAEGFQDRGTALVYFRDLLADHEASGAEALGVLLELSPDERAAHLAVGRDVRAKRVEPAGRHVDDLLRDAREIRRLASETHELRRVLRAKHLHAEAVVEAPLLGGLDDRRVADVLRRRFGIVQRVRLRDWNPEVMRVRVEAALVQDRIDHRKLAERDAVARLE